MRSRVTSRVSWYMCCARSQSARGLVAHLIVVMVRRMERAFLE